MNTSDKKYGSNGSDGGDGNDGSNYIDKAAAKASGSDSRNSSNQATAATAPTAALASMEGRQQRLQWSNVREGVNETMAVKAGSDSGYKRSDNRDGSDSGDRVAVAGATSATDVVAIEGKQRQLQHQRRWRWQQAPTTAKGAALTVEAATGNGDGGRRRRRGRATATGDGNGVLYPDMVAWWVNIVRISLFVLRAVQFLTGPAIFSDYCYWYDQYNRYGWYIYYDWNIILLWCVFSNSSIVSQVIILYLPENV